VTGLAWRKHAAVTAGGKPFFYHLVTVERGEWRATVVWNRSVRAYAVEALVRLPNGVTTGRLVEYVRTVQAGKALAERTIAGGS
jgi:hypothetical protein